MKQSHSNNTCLQALTAYQQTVSRLGTQSSAHHQSQGTAPVHQQEMLLRAKQLYAAFQIVSKVLQQVMNLSQDCKDALSSDVFTAVCVVPKIVTTELQQLATKVWCCMNGS